MGKTIHTVGQNVLKPLPIVGQNVLKPLPIVDQNVLKPLPIVGQNVLKPLPIVGQNIQKHTLWGTKIGKVAILLLTEPMHIHWESPPHRHKLDILFLFTGEKIECQICGFKVGNILLHMKTHSQKTFRCNECNYAGKTAETLKSHIKHGHILKGKKPFQCGHCSYRSVTKANVTKHIQVQHPQSPIIVHQLEDVPKISQIRLDCWNLVQQVIIIIIKTSLFTHFYNKNGKNIYL